MRTRCCSGRVGAVCTLQELWAGTGHPPSRATHSKATSWLLGPSLSLLCLLGTAHSFFPAAFKFFSIYLIWDKHPSSGPASSSHESRRTPRGCGWPSLLPVSPSPLPFFLRPGTGVMSPFPAPAEASSQASSHASLCAPSHAVLP